MMSNLDPNILAKIKKCLALTSSDNPTEAATAMRQAKSLMDKHGVASHQIVMSDIGEATVGSRTMARDKPARWEAELAAMIGRAFGCKMMLQKVIRKKGFGHANEGGYVYVGLKQQSEVAAYTAAVLIRKCKSARQKWITDNFDGMSKGVPGLKRKITRMGDAFAEGWAHSISKLVADFANPPEVEAAITAHIDSQASGDAQTRDIPKNAIGRHEQMAAAAGCRAAQGERLYRPMHGASQGYALPSGSA